MKLSCLLLFLFCNFAFGEVYVSKGKITANFVNQRLDTVIQLFCEQTDIELYVEDDVKDRKVSADFENLSIGFGVKKLLEGTGINHVVVGNTDGTQAIFIGSSQEPQRFFKNVDNSSSLFRQRRSNTQNYRILKPGPSKKKNASDSKTTQPQIKPAVSIPTAGTLSNQTPILIPMPIGKTGKQNKKN
jgi:hypothetical protein